MADVATSPQPERAPSERSGDRIGDEKTDKLDRAAATRQALLEAAHAVFTTVGFVDANVTQVVERAGASVGSLYHHFGGKADLYSALFDDYQHRQEERAAAAVRAARDAGESGPIRLFVAGTRGFLRGCWEERALTRLFLSGDGPPTFELVARRRYRDWVRANERLLQADGSTFSDALCLVLTTVAAEAGHEVALREDEDAAMQLAEDVLALISRVGDPEPRAG